jgi:hypothetical protein
MKSKIFRYDELDEIETIGTYFLEEILLDVELVINTEAKKNVIKNILDNL